MNIIIVFVLCLGVTHGLVVTREIGSHPAAVLVHGFGGDVVRASWRQCDFELWEPVAVVACAHVSTDGCPPPAFRFKGASGGVVAWMAWDERVFVTLEVSDSRLWVMRDGVLETTVALPSAWPEISFRDSVAFVDGTAAFSLPKVASLMRCGFGDVPHTVQHASRVRCGAVQSHPELAKRVSSVRLDLFKLFECDSAVGAFATSEDLYRGNLTLTYANATSVNVVFQV